MATTGDKNKQAVTNWEEHTSKDSLNDVSKFARDLSLSLENRIESCGVTEAVGKANFFDIGETFQLLSKVRVSND